MRVLSLDTATTSCSVAVIQDRSLLAEVTIDVGQTHAKHLMGMIDKAVDLSGLSIEAMDGFAVTRGPGSFTGLRIGIASIKGLAMATDKPLVGVSTLETLAMQAAAPSVTICPLLDARRGEVYSSRYRFEGGRLVKLMGDSVSKPVDAIDGLDGPVLFVGQGAEVYRPLLTDTFAGSARFAPVMQNTIRASTVAHLSLPAFEAGRTENVAAFIPAYLRKSDAEIKLSSQYRPAVCPIRGGKISD